MARTGKRMPLRLEVTVITFFGVMGCYCSPPQYLSTSFFFFIKTKEMNTDAVFRFIICIGFVESNFATLLPVNILTIPDLIHFNKLFCRLVEKKGKKING